MPKKQKKSSSKKIWLFTLASLLILVIMLAIAYPKIQDFQRDRQAESYIGLTLSEAQQKAEKEGFSEYEIQAHTAGQTGTVYRWARGLILYVDYSDNEKVVDAEIRTERHPKEKEYIGLAETEAVHKAKKEGFNYVIVPAGKYEQCCDLTTELALFVQDGKVVDARFMGAAE